MEPRESDREYGHHIVAPLIGWCCSAQPKMADTRQINITTTSLGVEDLEILLAFNGRM